MHHLALKFSFWMNEFNFLLKFLLLPLSDQRFVGILSLSLLSSFLKSNFLYGPRISLPLYTKQDVKKKFYLDKISSSNKATCGGRIKHIASVWRNGNGASGGFWLQPSQDEISFCLICGCRNLIDFLCFYTQRPCFGRYFFSSSFWWAAVALEILCFKTLVL